MNELVKKGLERTLRLSVDLWQRKQAGEDMSADHERWGDSFSRMLRIGSGEIPHDHFLQYCHSSEKLMAEVKRRKGE